ncbi:MAG: methyltransferase domain-containing protein [Candidatus Lokiarchaeota archaeon]|nr:methyltransferase domain-containing protein [Candidatus Lokiarchaeota archaeon]
MKLPIYPSAVYSFLEFIKRYEKVSDEELGRKILDCGAGGKNPPLGLFNDYGFETYGIDISQKQIDAALQFAEENDMELKITLGDMRELPFEDELFDFVYEYYSMVHLSKSDTKVAISEMSRVLRSGGFLFLGFMSFETWPIHGEEKQSGEFWMEEDGESIVHSFFKDDEILSFLDDFTLYQMEKRTQRYPWRFRELPKEYWLSMFDDSWTSYSSAEWEEMYDQIEEKQKYTHSFFILRKK